MMKVHSLTRKTVSVLASLALLSTMVVAVPMESLADEVTTISSVAEWNNFAADVNNGTNDYSEKTVKLTADLSGANLTPVGTKENPFNGTFDGGMTDDVDSTAILNVNLSGTSYVGLFGAVGEGGVIQNLDIDGGTVTITDAEEVVEYVGSIVGFCKGSLVNCTSSAKISITSVLDGTDVDDTNNGLTIEEVGGLAGVVYGDMTGCNFTGSLTVHTDAKPGSDGSIAQNIAGLAGLFGGYVEETEDSSACIAHYGGVQDVTEDTPISLASGCKNKGDIAVEATSQEGVDRFGETTTTKCNNIGGIAGYSLGNITNCSNTGTVSSWNGLYNGSASPYDSSKQQRIGCGDGVGGVCGNLRAESITSPTYTGEDPGMSDERELTFTECTNEGEVVGLHAAGGLLGVAGTYTVVKACKNSGEVSGTRWNKPAPAGIAGQAYGTVCYCYNTGDVMTETGGGYYAAGIVGTLNIFTDSATGARKSPISEIYACYSIGTILASGQYRSGTIVGENNGNFHNCASLSNTNTSNANSAVGENNGTYDSSTCITASTAYFRYSSRNGNTAVCPVYVMNSCAPADGWEYYYVIDADTDVLYPELNIWTTTTTTDLSTAIASNPGTITDAAYTSQDIDPSPSLSNVTITIDGTSTVFYEYSDYRVVPEKGARSPGGPYTATIEGIGRYTGSPLTIPETDEGEPDEGEPDEGEPDEGEPDEAEPVPFTFEYYIGPGDFSDCTAIVDSVIFNWDDQNPQTDKDGTASPLTVTVREKWGTELAAGTFSYYVNPANISVNETTGKIQITVDGTTEDLDAYQASTGKTYDEILDGTQQPCVDANEPDDADPTATDPYYVIVVSEDETYYTGITYGTFAVRRANLFTGKTSDSLGDKWTVGDFEYNGQRWKWDITGWDFYQEDSKGNKTYGMSFPYEAQSIEPKLVANSSGATLQYLGRDLEYGKDYTIVYGDPGRDDLIDQDTDNPNLFATTVSGNPRACMTVRYVPGGNFTNYVNMYFTINTVSLTKDCKITVPKQKSYTYTGKSIKPTGFKVTLGSKTLKEGTDYKITYSNNKAAGTAKAKITGLNSVVGTYTWNFNIVPKKGKTFTIKKGATAGTYKVTGSKKATLIKGGKKTKSAKIGTARCAGTTYKVTAIGNKAYKGNKRLKKLTVGKQVKTIGKKAFFNCKKLKSVKIKSTKLKKVGAKAFAKTPKLSQTLVPKNKVSKYKKLLKKGGFKKQVSKL